MEAGMIELSELSAAAQKAFPADKITPSRDASWQLITEMGWLMLELSEEQDGLGLGRDASATVHFELGHILPATPLLSALLGLQAVAASDRLVDKQGWVERLCAGEYVPLNLLSGNVENSGDGRLNGTISGIFEADMATHIVAATAGRYDLIPLDAVGVAVTERPLWDPSRRLFDIELVDYIVNPNLVIAEGDDAGTLHDRLSPSAQLALAADSLGAANTVLNMTVEYLNTRRQFDRPLAMFQALKHRVADLKARLVAAEALLWSRANEVTSMLEMGALKAHCTQLFCDIAEDAVQLHGGIGLTDEYPCHLFLKRAFLNAELCGNTDYWEQNMGCQALKASSSDR